MASPIGCSESPESLPLVYCGRLNRRVPLTKSAPYYYAGFCFQNGHPEQCPHRQPYLAMHLQQFGTEAENPHLDLDPVY